jgi:16S rRNA (cytosine1402-N4)-methyltransferase
MNETHIPVLLNESIEGLNIKENGTYLDLTLGRAGHSSVILSKLSKNGLLIGVDQDDEAIEASRERLSKISDNFILVRNNFVNIDEILEGLKIEKVDGILMDLGVSSPQFDDQNRGFSYRFDSELDMRMDKRNPLTAKKVVNEYSLEELTRIFNEYGEEKYSYSIAKNIVKTRDSHPINTTFELVEIIKRSKPAKELAKVGHPAKQIFQALRIEVNDEINVLKKTLTKALNHLNKGGRLAVITFHSGEDKIVKYLFKDLTVTEGNRYDLPINEEKKEYQLITRKGIKPTEEEIKNNHRSVSSVLRIIEKI